MRIFASLTTATVIILTTHLQPVLADGDAAKGQAAFKRCAACHATTDQNRVGPGLGGVIGRRTGTAPDYKYSPALSSSNLVWDEQTLDSYLENPRKLVPGTRMTVTLSKPEDRQNIISYLKTLTLAN